MGIKMTLGKGNTLIIVILWFKYLTLYKVIFNPSQKRSETCILNDNRHRLTSTFIIPCSDPLKK
ncbi:hypothetical protein CXF71_14140 [Colwellia sp. 12G3]|nr:hypothetical protein CXF71_14140 [Colwellia sp. 12G3]